jgi:allophanate hydrolase
VPSRERREAGQTAEVPTPATVELAVVGAHLTGEPLNHQLTDRGAVLVETTRTAPCYRLYALNTDPPKPGLLRVAEGDQAAAIEVEVWRLSMEAFGSFVVEIPPPLGIGTIVLRDRRAVPGFICEPIALDGATEITAFAGWRAYRAGGSAGTGPVPGRGG